MNGSVMQSECLPPAADDPKAFLMKKAVIIAALAVVQTAIYTGLNRWTTRPSTEVPVLWFDESIPFWPWTVWPYLALISVPAVLACAIRSWLVFRRTVVAHVIAMTLTFAIFLAWPTHVVRPTIPTDGGWNAAVYRTLISIDGPGCAFPSGHVVLPAIVAWGLWCDRSRWRMCVLMAFMLASPSILTTGQHRLADFLGGLAVAALGMAAAVICLPGNDDRGGEFGSFSQSKTPHDQGADRE